MMASPNTLKLRKAHAQLRPTVEYVARPRSTRQGVFGAVLPPMPYVNQWKDRRLAGKARIRARRAVRS